MFGAAVTERGEPDGKPGPRSLIRASAEGNRASDDRLFDLWLEQRLRAAFEDVSREPIPPELIALIESHRRKH